LAFRRKRINTVKISLQKSFSAPLSRAECYLELKGLHMNRGRKKWTCNELLMCEREGRKENNDK